jgi:hypothetical protein
LSSVLPRQPTISANRDWWLFPLEGCCEGAPSTAQRDRDPNLFSYAIGSAPMKFATGGNGTLYCEAGWDSAEDWGTWSVGTHATLRMRLEPVPAGKLSLTLETHMVVGPQLPRRQSVISANRHQVAEAIYTPTSAAQTLHIQLPSGTIAPDGVLELSFDTTPAGSPRSAGVAKDDRMLGIGLVRLSIESEP